MLSRAPSLHLCAVAAAARPFFGASLLSVAPRAPFSASARLSAALPDVYDMRRSGAAIQVPKPPKRAAKVVAHTAARLAVVRAGLASQEKRVADHKKTLPQKARNHGLLYLIKKAAWEKGEGEE